MLENGQLVLASGNAGKRRELRHQLGPLNIEVRLQADFDVEEVDETGLTFVENALLKAREASRVSGLPALADDSGLVVDALGGRPGIYSARYAGEQADSADNNAKLLVELDGLPPSQRAAHFHCSLVLLAHPDDPDPLIAQGRWHGRILEKATGDGGFGYDPLFFDPVLGIAAAEMSLDEKARVSHRGLALNNLIGQLQQGD
ncbi:MAG: RdgB/HAM1 family non-canonical purine NTP pyrophosphatase [Pseudomonadota bacterium]